MINDQENQELLRKKKVAIIGAGPAGLSSAYQLSRSEDFEVVIFEADSVMGGLSKTIKADGFSFDIGPHRFYTKSKRVKELWHKLLPLQGKSAQLPLRSELADKLPSDGPLPERDDKLMLLIERLTRILYLKRLFSYPISLNKTSIMNLGIVRLFRIFFSYLKVKISPINPENSLEDFYCNRFGRELYNTFFKDYTEKVWGIAPDKISKEWGAQRVKGLSIRKIILNVLGLEKNKETSLIDSFEYPKYGAGQLFEEMGAQAQAAGVQINFGKKIIGIETEDSRIISLSVQDKNGQRERVYADYFISTMPVKELIRAFGEKASPEIRKVANGLLYRDMVIASILFEDKNGGVNIGGQALKDNWIYIQESGLMVGRLSICNNFSPFLLNKKGSIAVVMEYFCNEGDPFWSKKEAKLKEFASEELIKIGMTKAENIQEIVITKIPKAYPAYFGTYGDFDQIRTFVDAFENLFLIGRNGSHKYNNMDHSVLGGLIAADNIIKGVVDKKNIWEINTEEDYYEEGKNK